MVTCPTCGRRKITPHKVTDEIVREIRRLYRDEFKTRKELAQRFNLSTVTVTSVVRRRGRFATID